VTTAKFQVPKHTPGHKITILTSHPDIYYYATDESRTHAYENVEVLPPAPWLSSSQFMITSDNPRMGFRVIDIKNVVDISDGALGNSTDSGVQTISIKGSKGNEYHVTVENGRAVSCTCPGYSFRKTCRHLKEAEALVDS
jgi:hypothetical protein